MCCHCEKPFEGRRHYEKRGHAYCERDYKAVSEGGGEGIGLLRVIVGQLRVKGVVGKRLRCYTPYTTLSLNIPRGISKWQENQITGLS